jgi:hypothetical protein
MKKGNMHYHIYQALARRKCARCLTRNWCILTRIIKPFKQDIPLCCECILHEALLAKEQMERAKEAQQRIEENRARIKANQEYWEKQREREQDDKRVLLETVADTEGPSETETQEADGDTGTGDGEPDSITPPPETTDRAEQ